MQYAESLENQRDEVLDDITRNISTNNMAAWQLLIVSNS